MSATLCGLSLLPLAAVNPAWAHRQKPDRFPALHRQLDQLLIDQGLARENLALMLFSTRKRRFLYKLRENEPMVAASNAKLATTFAALIALTPNFRWRTKFFRAEDQNDPPSGGRQGLLVLGGGDPSLTTEDLPKIAVKLKASGLERVEGPLYYDSSRFVPESIPAAWGGAARAQPWFAPVSPFIMDSNTLDFFITTAGDAEAAPVLPEVPGDFLEVVSKLRRAPVSGPMVHVSQAWRNGKARFTFMGRVPEKPGSYPFSVAVERPVENFYHRLREALHRYGISGEMPLLEAAGRNLKRTKLYTHQSAPLRELITKINKESDNLAAESVVRVAALKNPQRPLSSQAGLKILRKVIAEEFPAFQGQVFLADGAGLNRGTRMSASFLVHLLSRVRSRNDFSAEYISSLSLGGWDGTLRYRKFPAAMRGRIRAKTGTLEGVQNLSGYLFLERDVIIFSFLINDSTRNYLSLQRAQDAVMTGVFERFAQPPSKPEAAKSVKPRKLANPAAPRKLKPPPPSYKPRRKS